MPGKANFDIRKVPFRLTSICTSHSSSLQSSVVVRIENAGVVEEDVEASEGAYGFIDGAAAFGGLANVGAQEDGLAAVFQDPLGDGVAALLVAAGDGDSWRPRWQKGGRWLRRCPRCLR